MSAPLTTQMPTYPSTIVGQSTTRSATFTATQPLTLTALSSTNPDFTFGAVIPALPATLAPGDTVTVPITFNATQAALEATTIRATTSVGPVDAALNATGLAAVAQLGVSTQLLSLGGTTPGGNQLHGNVVLSNVGSLDLTVTSVDLPTNAQYQMSGLPPNGSTIKAGDSVPVTVTFTPGATEGEFDDTFTVHSTGGDQAVDLTAKVASPPAVTVTPMTTDLGNVPLGATADASFTLTNTGGLPAQFVLSKPPVTPGFSALTALPEGTTLPTGNASALTETVRFHATKLGTFSDVWRLNPADGQGVRSVTFTADVVPSGKVPAPTPSRWQLNASAKFVNSPDPGAIQLTPPEKTGTDVHWMLGSAFLTKPVPSRYLRVSFDAWIGGGSGADGMGLVLADPAGATNKSTGVAGGGLGFSGIPGIAVALDTFQNSANPSSNFVGISDGPTVARNDFLHWIAANSGILPLEQTDVSPTGHVRTHVVVEIANGLATVTVKGTPALTDVPVNLPPNVLLGFTGASGGNDDEHTVSHVVVTLAAPDTKIVTRPAATTGSADARFTFTSGQPGATFTCRLDNRAASSCTSPRVVTVAPGAHTLSVQAVGPNGVVDPTPAIAHWTYASSTHAAHGYWMLGADGSVYAFGDAHVAGSLQDPTASHLTPTPSAHGYWIVNAAGHVYAFGDATAFGDAPALAVGERVATMSATPTGKGYWLFTSAGRVFAFGDARFFGDLSAVHLNGPIVDSVATTSGSGYYMVAADGGVFGFGDAHFFGSLGGSHLNQPIIGLVPTPSGRGYWMVASDGGVFAFGDAPFRGSLGSVALNRPIVGMVRFGNGYLLAASDGGIFDFSSSPFLGSLGGQVPPAPIIGVAAFGG